MTVTISFYCIGEAIVAVVSRPGVDTDVVELSASVGSIRSHLDRLAVQWDRCRLGSDFVARHQSKLIAATNRELCALRDALFAPLVGRLPAHGEVTIVPHGILHAVPWAALPLGDSNGPGTPALVDAFEITIAPSIEVQAHCVSRVRNRGSRILVAAIADDLAPQIEHEADVVYALFPSAELLRGDAATGSAVLQSASGAGMVHLAGHGWWRGDNPMFSAIKVHDRWLTAAELLGCDLDGTLVVLSACDTGRRRTLAGDEIQGFARALLGAGAATLVTCAWPADDAATVEFMRVFYAGVKRGIGPAAATRQAQLRLRERCEHPYYWAGFEAIGAP